MLKPLLALAATLALSAALPAQTPPDFKALVADLGKAPRQHPYLLFSAEDKPALLARIRGDRRSAEVLEKFLLEGRRLLHATVEQDTPPPREAHTRYVGADARRATSRKPSTTPTSSARRKTGCRHRISST
jgi:hypothetical protein